MNPSVILRNIYQLFVLLCCCCLSLPAFAQLKSDRKEETKEKGNKKKSPKKEKEDAIDEKPAADTPKESKTTKKESEKTSEADENDSEEESADHANHPKVTLGKEFKLNGYLSINRLNHITLRDPTSGKTYTARISDSFLAKKKFYVAAYDLNLNELYQKELELGKIDKEFLEYSGAILLGQQLYIVSDFYSKVRQKRELYLSLVGSDGSIERSEKAFEWDESSKESGNVEWVSSKDNSKLLIFNQLPIAKKDNEQKIQYVVLDKDFKQVRAGQSAFACERKSTITTERRLAKLRNLTLDNSNRVFALLETEIGKEYITELCQFVEGNKPLVKYDLGLNEKAIRYFKLFDTRNPNEVIATGSYAVDRNVSWFSIPNWSTYERVQKMANPEDFKDLPCHGTFMTRLNAATGEVVHKTAAKFSEDMYRFLGISGKERADGIQDLHLTWTYITPKDNVVLSFERRTYGFVDYMNRKPTADTKHEYLAMFAKTIFNIKYNSEGELLYQNFIPRALGVNTYTYGCIIIPQGEGYSLVFNDLRRTSNNFKAESELPTRLQEARRTGVVTRIVTINEDGEMKNATLALQNSLFIPTISVDDSKNTIMVLVLRKGNPAFVRLRY